MPDIISTINSKPLAVGGKTAERRKMNKGKFAIISRATNEAVIIDYYNRYVSVTQGNEGVVLKLDATEKIYVDCILLNIS